MCAHVLKNCQRELRKMKVIRNAKFQLIILVAITSMLSNISPAAAVGCTGAGCNGKDPDSNGCSPGSVVLKSTYSGGARSVTVDLKYSAACNAKWGRVQINYNPMSTAILNSSVTGTPGGPTQSGPSSLGLFSGDADWSNMLSGWTSIGCGSSSNSSPAGTFCTATG